MKNLIMIALFLLNACASVGERTIVRMKGHSEAPEWATLSQSTYIKSDRLYSVGFTEVNAGARISAAFRVSDNNARFEISREVTNDMAFIFQNLEEGLDDSGTLARFYGTEVSKLIVQNIRQEKRYWEKVQSFDESGEVIYKLRLYSLVSIKKSDLRKAVKMSLDKGKGITPSIKNQIDLHITKEIQKIGEL